MTTTSVTPQMLALNGGKPVRETLLPYGRQSIEESDIKAVVQVLRSDWLTTGPKVDEFEHAFATRVGSAHAVSFSSGTAALHAAAFAAGLQGGDEAITTPMTFAATANCVLYQGATPIFADVSSDTLNLDPEEVVKKLSSKTRAIFPVDYAGHPADLGPIIALARIHGLIVIEDACHATGATYRGKQVGAIADMTVFSFHPVKHITTGEGGMVTTNSPHFAENLRRFRNHGISSDARARQKAGRWDYEMVALGYNYRLPDVACALGIQQLKRLDENLARRRVIAAKYSSVFRDLPGVIIPPVRCDANPAWHLYPIRLDLARVTADRATIFRALRAENIGVNVHYIPVYQHPYYRERFGSRDGQFPVAEDAYSRLISLPMFHGMTDRDVDDVIAAVLKVMRHFSNHSF
jgi:perosamine synthetase